MTKTISEWQRDIYTVAREHGWWEGLDTPERAMKVLPEKVALIHSELTEAWTAEFMELHFEEGKPEGFWVEVADAVIRVLDLGGALGVDQGKDEPFDPKDVIAAVDGTPQMLLYLHVYASTILERYRRHGDVHGAVRMFVQFASAVIERWNKRYAPGDRIDFWHIVDVKHEYNKTRSHKHGGKVC